MDFKTLTRKQSYARKYRKKIKYLSLGLLAPTSQIDNIDKLEKSMDQETRRQNPQKSIIEEDITEKQKKRLLEMNQYWNKFQQMTRASKEKLQIQQINVNAKCMDNVMNQSMKQIRLKKNAIEKQQMITQEKYKKYHSFFEQQNLIKHQIIKLQRQENEKQLMKLKKKEIVTKLQLSLLNKEINKDQKKLKTLSDELQKMEQDQLNFLKLLLKKGCYRYDGVTWILQQMVLLKYVPREQDLPEILDLNSKRCLIKQYYNQKDKIQKSNNEETGFRSRTHTNSFTIEQSIVPSLDAIIQNSNTKRIYQQTGKYFFDWVHNEGWKRKLQKTDYSSLQKIKFKWRQNQRRRINESYSQTSKKQVSKILFGVKKTRSSTNQSAHQLTKV